MKLYSIELSSSINGLSGTDSHTYSYTVKGPLMFSVDISKANIGLHKIAKLNLSFGDDNNKSNDVSLDFINFDSLTQSVYNHIYYPTNSRSLYTNYFPTLTITFSNFKKYTYKFNLLVYKESFYDKSKRFKIDSAQFIDDNYDSVFVVVTDVNGDKFNIAVK